MFRLKDVLFPTDFSPYAQFAMNYAIAMARRFGGRLHVAHVLDSKCFSQGNFMFNATRGSMETMIASMREHAEVRLEHVAQIAMEHGVSASVHVERGAPWERTVALAERLNVGLVVIPTHGRSGFDRLVYGSCCERVVRQSPVPVLCIKHPEHEFVEESSRTIHLQRVLFPTDFSDFSLQVLPYAQSVCRLFGATLHLLYVTEPALVLPESMPQAPALFEAEQIDPAREQLAGIKDSIKDIAVDTEVKTGLPYRQICDAVLEHDVDLVLIPTHGRSGISHLLFGSVAEKVVRSAGCPVMTVRPGRVPVTALQGAELEAAERVT